MDYESFEIPPIPTDPEDKGCRSIVRLKTSYWRSARGLHMRKDLIRMKRLSWDYQILEEDADMIGAEDVIGNIIDFDSLKDGLYEVSTCNETHDWESGYLDSYDYKLTPFKP